MPPHNSASKGRSSASMGRRKSTPLKPDFSTYFREHGPRLQTKYPFLKAAQIKGKAREMWKKLPSGEKAEYVSCKLQLQTNSSTPKNKKKTSESSNAKDDFSLSSPEPSAPRPSAASPEELKFQGIGERGYTSGRKPASKPAPDIFHTQPTSTTSILRSSEKNKPHNVSFASPSQWISRSLTESPDDTDLALTPSDKNSGSPELFCDNDARDDSSQDLAYGIGSDESDVDKSNQLKVLHTKPEKQVKKTRGQRNSIKAGKGKKTATKGGAKKAKKAPAKATKMAKKMSPKKTMDGCTKDSENENYSEIDEAPFVIEKDDSEGNTPDSPYILSQNSINNVDDNDSDHDKDMMLAQLYMESSEKKKGQRCKRNTRNKKAKAKESNQKEGFKKQGNVEQDENAIGDPGLSFGSPLSKLNKKAQQYAADDCFGFNTDDNTQEDQIVRILPLKELSNLPDRDAMVVVDNQVITDGENEQNSNSCALDMRNSVDHSDTEASQISQESPNVEGRSRSGRIRRKVEKFQLPVGNKASPKAEPMVQGRKRRRGDDADVFKTPSIPGVSVKELASKVKTETPQLTTGTSLNKAGKKGEDSLTTPLMPDTLVQKTFEQAAEPPRKRRRSSHSNQHDHSTAHQEATSSKRRHSKCARKSLVNDGTENQSPINDIESTETEVLSPFDRRKQGIPNENRIRLTPRPKKEKERVRKQSGEQRRQTRRSTQMEEPLRNEDDPKPVTTEAKKAVTQKARKSKLPRDCSDIDNVLPSSSDSTEDKLEMGKPWKAPLLQAAATYQLATKYKELDTFDSIFDDDEAEEKAVVAVGTSGALAEAIGAMREVAHSKEEEQESAEVTSDLTSSPSQLSAMSPALSGVTEFSDVPSASWSRRTRSAQKKESPLQDSGKDTGEDPDQGDLLPYMQQLQHSVEQSLMDMFDEPKTHADTGRRNLVSGYSNTLAESCDEEDLSELQNSQTDIFL